MAFSFFLQILPFDRPLDDPVAVFALAIVIFLVFPLVLKRFQLPGIIGVLLAGVLVGPHVLNLLSRGETIRLLGQVGLLYLIFISGLEIDLNDFIDNPTKSAVFALVTFSLPLAFGIASGVTFLGFSLVGAILFASIFSSHTILGYPVVERLGIATNDAITTAITATVLTDTTALLVLTVIEQFQSQQGSVGVLFWGMFVFKLAVFFVGIWIVVPRIGRWFFSNVNEESYFEFLFAMAVLFVTAYLATFAGAEPIIGAFLAGLTMNRLVPSTSTLMNRIGFVGDSLFVPFFMLSVGMLFRPRPFLRELTPWLVAGTMLAIMFSMKLVAAGMAGRLYDYEQSEWLSMFGLTTGQAAAALAVATIGQQLGLFGTPTVNATVLLILVTGLVSPTLSERFGRQVVEGEEQEEYEPSDAPQRILIPLTQYTDNTESLLDLAMLLRESASEEPIHALTVVQREGQQLDVGERYTGSDQSEANGGTEEQQPHSPEDQQAAESNDQQTEESDEQQADGEQPDEETEADVAEAEDTLEEAEEQGASAEVSIETQTRVVESNISAGIAQAIEENRITTVIVGWNNRRRFGQRLFGSTTDQLLQRTTELVAVANLAQPVNTAERLVVILPGRIATHPGFFDGIHTVGMAAEQLGISIQYLVVGGNEDQYGSRISSVEPETSFDIESITSWGEFRGTDERFEEGDFVIALTPREGGRGWDSALSDLPQQLASD
ncbi:MAG TPA: cation:proton antiporter, partial [Halococcus sp.]|nr:cation:proton antiporter [Halococcus sp.]